MGRDNRNNRGHSKTRNARDHRQGRPPVADQHQRDFPPNPERDRPGRHPRGDGRRDFPPPPNAERERPGRHPRGDGRRVHFADEQAENMVRAAKGVASGHEPGNVFQNARRHKANANSAPRAEGAPPAEAAHDPSLRGRPRPRRDTAPFPVHPRDLREREAEGVELPLRFPPHPKIRIPGARDYKFTADSDDEDDAEEEDVVEEKDVEEDPTPLAPLHFAAAARAATVPSYARFTTSFHDSLRGVVILSSPPVSFPDSLESDIRKDDTRPRPSRIDRSALPFVILTLFYVLLIIHERDPATFETHLAIVARLAHLVAFAVARCLYIAWAVPTFAIVQLVSITYFILFTCLGGILSIAWGVTAYVGVELFSLGYMVVGGLISLASSLLPAFRDEIINAIWSATHALFQASWALIGDVLPAGGALMVRLVMSHPGYALIPVGIYLLRGRD